MLAGPCYIHIANRSRPSLSKVRRVYDSTISFRCTASADRQTSHCLHAVGRTRRSLFHQQHRNKQLSCRRTPAIRPHRMHRELLLLHMSHVPWFVRLPVCSSHSRAVQKRLNRSRWRLGEKSRLAWSQGTLRYGARDPRPGRDTVGVPRRRQPSRPRWD